MSAPDELDDAEIEAVYRLAKSLAEAIRPLSRAGEVTPYGAALALLHGLREGARDIPAYDDLEVRLIGIALVIGEDK